MFASQFYHPHEYDISIVEIFHIFHMDFTENVNFVANYIMDNLHCFDMVNYDDFDENELVEVNEFLWDVTSDTVIPYLVGLTPKTFLLSLKDY